MIGFHPPPLPLNKNKVLLHLKGKKVKANADVEWIGSAVGICTEPPHPSPSVAVGAQLPALPALPHSALVPHHPCALHHLRKQNAS